MVEIGLMQYLSRMPVDVEYAKTDLLGKTSKKQLSRSGLCCPY